MGAAAEAGLAQWLERALRKGEVGSSILPFGYAFLLCVLPHILTSLYLRLASPLISVASNALKCQTSAGRSTLFTGWCVFSPRPKYCTAWVCAHLLVSEGARAFDDGKKGPPNACIVWVTPNKSFLIAIMYQWKYLIPTLPLSFHFNCNVTKGYNNYCNSVLWTHEDCSGAPYLQLVLQLSVRLQLTLQLS